jgi:NSS family neurotransmitter:Na+ symporter
MSSKATFTSKLGVIAATVGSAVGLGTVWRFPYEVQNNGGSIFLVTYLVCVLLMGIPVMLAEFSLGRGSGSDSVGAFRRLTPGKPWWIIGATAVLASYLILIYYMVVAGWTLEYLWMSITNQLYAGIDTAPNRTAVFSSIMNESLSTGWRPAFWTSVMILLNILVLLRGVKKGIERMSNTLMPLLFVILVVFCCVALSLPNAMEGVDFFLRPDFSKMNPQVLISAVGQAFFSLSLGMGILITYSSYYPKTTKLARTSVTVSGLVFLVAVLMGLIIFPAVKSFGITSDTQGVTLIFVTLPEIFTQMPATQLWSILFFFLLVVAALTSTVSVAEVTIAFLAAKFRMHRKKACYVTLVPLFLLSSICAMSLGPLSHLQILGKTIFDALDYLTSNIMLPVVAIFVCIYVGHVLPKSFLRDEMTNRGTMRSAVVPTILFIIRYIAPLLIAAVLINKLLG